MNKKLKQKIFNKVYTHLRVQGPCVDHREGPFGHVDVPKYHFRGKSCAIGCLIPKAKCRRIEDLTITDDRVFNLLQTEYPSMTESDVPFLKKLQVAHDLYYASAVQGSLNDWVDRMTDIAKSYKLTVPKRF